jgi:hypothetical protein
MESDDITFLREEALRGNPMAPADALELFKQLDGIRDQLNMARTTMRAMQALLAKLRSAIAHAEKGTS